MPAEIDTGGHRVLHCDSRADCPTHVSTPANEWRADRARLPVRVDGNGSNGSQRRDRRRKSCVRKAEPLDRGSPSNRGGGSSPTGLPRIGDKEETILGGRDLLAEGRVLTHSSSRRREGGGGDEGEDGAGACRASRESPCASEDVAKDERFSVTWNPRESAADEIERAESRLRDGAERYQLAAADASGITEHRSLRARSWTRSPFYESETLGADPTDQPGGTRTARGNSLLSSHRLRTRAKEETCEGSFKDVDEEFSNDGGTRTDEDRRADSSGRRDERPEGGNIGQESAANWKRIGRLYSFLQLVFLLFFVAFGRYGPLGSSSVLRVNARPIANGLSVLGIGIIGAVNARSIEPIGDAGVRAERSANLSHMTGRYRGKIQMYIKNRHLQILPDGTVNGSNDDTSDYSEYAFLYYRSMISMIASGRRVNRVGKRFYANLINSRWTELKITLIRI